MVLSHVHFAESFLFNLHRYLYVVYDVSNCLVECLKRLIKYRKRMFVLFNVQTRTDDEF